MADAAKKSEDKGEQTPSMEEILKSIRGVISGDEGAPAATGGDTAAPAEHAEDDILELTEMAEADATELNADSVENKTNVDLGGKGMAENNEQTPDKAAVPAAEVSEKSVLDEIDATLAEKKDEAPAAVAATPEVKVETPAPVAAPQAQTVEEEDDILASEQVSESGSASVSENAARLIKNEVADKSSDSLKQFVNSIPKPHVESVYTRGGTSLEDLVVEALKPYLAEWLNKNLPTLVKQIVTKEIKKLVPREDEDQ